MIRRGRHRRCAAGRTAPRFSAGSRAGRWPQRSAPAARTPPPRRPRASARTAVSIFIASRLTSRSPLRHRHARLRRHARHHPGHRRADVPGLRPGRSCAAARGCATWLLSGTRTERGWPLSSKNTVRVPSSCGSLRGDVAHDERLAALQVDADLLPGLHAVEEHRGRQDRGVAVAARARARSRPTRAGTSDSEARSSIGHRPRQLLLDPRALGAEVDRRQRRARARRSSGAAPLSTLRCSAAGKPP